MRTHPESMFTTLLHKPSFCLIRPSTDHCHRLLALGVAGKGKDHCHGNQHQGGQDEEVRAVLACRKWEWPKLWSIQCDCLGAAYLCRLHYQDHSTCGEYIVDVLFGVFVFEKIYF